MTAIMQGDYAQGTDTKSTNLFGQLSYKSLYKPKKEKNMFVQ